MLIRLTPLVTAAALLASASNPALAASDTADAAAPGSTRVPPVTVQGQAPPKMIQEQAQAFTRTFPATTTELGQIARWRDPLCVQVFGLAPDVAAKVQARVENVGKAVGLAVGSAGCHGNIQIIFTGKPQALMDGVARKREMLLGYFHIQDRQKLKTVTRPIQAWYVTASLGGAGNVPGQLFAYYETTGNAMLPRVQWNREVIDDPTYLGPTGCGDAPHFTACLRGVFKNVLIVADSTRLQGRDAGLLSDYLSMLALSQPKSLDGCNALPSVIDLFAPSGCEGRDVPDGLTPADAAYLTSLYQSDPESRLAFSQSDIAGRMATILINASPGGR
jgi:hypothetical protein